MRRTKLLWFAGGAGTTAVVSVIAQFLTPPPPAKTSCLVMYEAFHAGSSPGQVDKQSRAFETGEMLRQCGAKTFDKINIDEGLASVAELPIIEENEPAFGCALRESAARGLETTITNCTNANATSH